MSQHFTGQFPNPALQPEGAHRHQQMSRHMRQSHHLSSITLPPNLLQPFWSKGKKGAISAPLLLPQQQPGGETQINAVFPEHSKETSSCCATWSPAPPHGLSVQGRWEPILIYFWFDTALWVTPPPQQLEECSHRIHEDVLLLLPTNLILDTKVQEGPGICLQPFSRPYTEVRASGQEHTHWKVHL